MIELLDEIIGYFQGCYKNAGSNRTRDQFGRYIAVLRSAQKIIREREEESDD